MSDFSGSFLTLVNGLLSERLVAKDFKIAYMSLWRECRDAGSLDVLNASSRGAFDRIFTAAESFCENPNLRDSDDLDEQQLVSAVAAIAEDLPS